MCVCMCLCVCEQTGLLGLPHSSPEEGSAELTGGKQMFNLQPINFFPLSHSIAPTLLYFTLSF